MRCKNFSYLKTAKMGANKENSMSLISDFIIDVL